MSSKTETFRVEGNTNFANEDYFEALLSYNEMLMAGRKEKKKIRNRSMSLAFANRSAVYLKVKEFEKCLENIRWAKDHDYPQEKLPKLIEREEKCKEEMKRVAKKDPENDPMNFFKLSYKPHPKIPFIVDCLELRKDLLNNPGIYTTRDLKPGDVIAIEDPFFHETSEPSRRCAFCFKSNTLSLIPCAGEMMFCSKNCFNKFHCRIQKFLELACSPSEIIICIHHFKSVLKALEFCGGLDDLQKIYSEAETSKKTIFDYNLTNLDDPATKKNFLRCVASLSTTASSCFLFGGMDGIADTLSARLANMTVMTVRAQNAITKFWDHSLKAFIKNVTSERNSDKFCTFKLYTFDPLFNHSCDPNVEIVYGDEKSIVVVNRPVKAGSQLFQSMLSGSTFATISKEQRQKTLKFKFPCYCIACIKSYPEQELEKNLRLGSIQETIDELKINWKTLKVMFDQHPSSKTCNILDRNSFLLEHLARYVFCPFLPAYFV